MNQQSVFPKREAIPVLKMQLKANAAKINESHYENRRYFDKITVLATGM